MGMDALEVSFFGRVLPIPPYLVIRSLGRVTANNHGKWGPKLVLNETPLHVNYRDDNFLMIFEDMVEFSTIKV
jgi:hypothetical protein